MARSITGDAAALALQDIERKLKEKSGESKTSISLNDYDFVHALISIKYITPPPKEKIALVNRYADVFGREEVVPIMKNFKLSNALIKTVFSWA